MMATPRMWLGLRGLVGAMALATVCALMGCSQAPEAPLRVGTNVWPGYEALYLARSLGHYDDTPIKLVEFPSATGVIRAYRNGLLEVAAVTMDEALQLADLGQSPQVILIADVSAGADVIIGTPNIESLEGLRGRRVGVESTALGAFVLARALQTVGMTSADVEVVSLTVSEHEQAFMEDRVEAVVTFEPVRTRLLNAGARQLFDSSQMPNEILDVLVAREEVLSERRAILETLVRGWFRAQEFADNNPNEAARRAADRQGISAAEFREALTGLHIPDLAENRSLLGDPGRTLGPAVRKLADSMVEQRLLNKKVDAVPLLRDEIVQTVRP